MKHSKLKMNDIKDMFGTKEGRNWGWQTYEQSVIFKAMGYTKQEIESPRIAIVNSWSEQSPGHIHLRAVADAVRAGVRMAGAMPFELNVLGNCTILAEGIDEGEHYDLPQREVILSSIETALHVGQCDGWVGICTCDKIVPAMIYAAIRLNRPCIIVTGGPMLPGEYQGKWVAVGAGYDIIHQKIKEGQYSDEVLEKLTNRCGYSAGACAEMTTGNTMQILAEAMGITLPFSSIIPAVVSARIRSAKEAGMQIMHLVKYNIRPRDIITREAIRNAIAVHMAVCGGTNALIHIQAFAWEAKLNVTLDDWDEISRRVPTLCPIAPSGPYSVCDLHFAGGIPAVMKEIRENLNLDCLTVTRKTVGENIEPARVLDSQVIRPKERPLWSEGSVAVLKGNLAPRGAVIRHTIIKNKKLLRYNFRAKVFDVLDDAISSIVTGKPKAIRPGDGVVCRYQGPRGAPAMVCVSSVVQALGVSGMDKVALFTDGRLSGCTSSYPAIAHICPEAQIGGPLAVVQDGDIIKLDVSRRKLELDLTAAEIKKRFAGWTSPDPAPEYQEGVLALYARFALQADQGAVWPTRWEEIKKM